MDFSETTFNETVDQEPVEYYEEKKNTNYKALITYAIAVVCLLLGLFLPLFGEKGILALQLPQVVNGLFKTSFGFGKDFASNVTYPTIYLFGIEKLEVKNLLLWVALLYAVVTVLALLAVIPVGLLSSKGKRSANGWAYIFETAAVVVLSVYLIMAIPGVCADKKAIDYSLLIAFGGPLLILIVQAFMFKKATGFVKVVLFLLSAIALFAMFEVFTLITALNEPLTKLLGDTDKLTISGLFVGNLLKDGIDYIKALFTSAKNLGDVLKLMPEAKDKAAFLLGTILCTLVVLNYFFDILGLSSKGKSAGYLFNLIRYGLEFIAFVALLITVIVAKYTLGLLLLLVGVLALLQLLISLIRFLMNHKRKKREKAGDYDEDYAEETEEYSFGESDYYASEKKAQSAPATQSGAYNTIIPDNYTNEPEPFAPPAEPVTFQVYEEAAPSTVQAEPAQSQPVFTEPAPVQPAEPVAQPIVTSAPVESPAVKEEPASFTSAPTFSEPATVQPEDHGDAFQSRTPFGEGVTNPAPSFYEPAEKTSEPEEEVLPPYTSDTDEFMDKLSNEEKYEFADLFINKTRTDLGKIPTYNVNGNNKKFFSAVFIYLGKIRPVISNGLLNKIYQEMKML